MITQSYPVVDQTTLEPAVKRGLFGLGQRERKRSELPKPAAHQALVFQSGGEWFLDYSRLGMRDSEVVNATNVSVVDMRHNAPVTVQLVIPSADADEFRLYVTFDCTVTDPIGVVRNGVDATVALTAYLRKHHRIFELGIAHKISQVNELRRQLNAQVIAYTKLKPPQINGLSITLTNVEILTPKEVAELERESRSQRNAHRLETEKNLDRHELDYLRMRHEQAFATERLQSQRSQWQLAGEMAADPTKALLLALVSGERNTAEVADALLSAEQERQALEQLREQRDHEDAVEDRRWRREQEHEDMRHQRALKVSLIKQLIDRGHFDMKDVEVGRIVDELMADTQEPALTADEAQQQIEAADKAARTKDAKDEPIDVVEQAVDRSEEAIDVREEDDSA